jgi:L-2-hydroxyglutarate oxidase LhgO
MPDHRRRGVRGIMNATDIVDAVVIGAGVVGLAVARALAMAGMGTVVAVERNRRFGEETSSRNSGVVHSGIYYPGGSLKRRLCVRGRELLYGYCRERGIAHRRCGKLIVAQGPQVAALRALHDRGVANGVVDLQWLDAKSARQLEPEVSCAAAVLSPSTGIVDVHELMVALLADFEARGGMLVVNSPVSGVRAVAGGLELTVDGDQQPYVLVARRVVNAAGLDSTAVAHRVAGYPKDRIPRAYLAKGNYFTCPGRPFQRLVYPMPDEAGLGIHATLDLDGSVRFGPDVEWVDALDYAVDADRSDRFRASIREYWPRVDEVELSPGYAGIRPKIVGPGQKAADFVIEGPREHGVAGLVSLFGIESPGLTAALAIGEWVTALLRQDVAAA